MPLTKKLESKVRKLADTTLNCCSAGEILIKEWETGPSLMIEVTNYHFGNFIDAGSQMRMLDELKKLGVVGDHVKTMWLGFYDHQLFLWCSV